MFPALTPDSAVAPDANRGFSVPKSPRHCARFAPVNRGPLDAGMTVVDYNGQGRWSRVGIIERYRDHARRFRVAPRDLSPAEHIAEGKHWVYPVMEKVIEAVEAGDVAAAEVALEFVEEVPPFRSAER